METARAIEPAPAVPSLWAEDDPTETPPAEEAAAAAPPRRRRRWRWLLVALLALGAAGGGVAAVRARGTKPAVSFETVPVSRGRIVVQVTASGTVSALKTVLVGSQVSGRVAELHADFNDYVKKGQLLARLDTQLYAAALEQARANQALVRSNVAKAEAQLADAQRTLARQKTLGDAHYLATEVVESAASTAEVARATLAGARAQARQSAASVHQAELNLAMTAIHSPIDGVVISRSVDVGQTVAASLQAPTLFTLAEDLRKMQVEAHVSESDVARLAAGMPVTFTVDAFPGRPFAGKLRQVRNAAETVQNVVTYDAIVDVDNSSLELRPGMTANVTFVVAERDRALRIPNAALRFRPPRATSEGGARTPAADRRVVFTREGDGVRPVRVRVGVTDGSFTELVEGPLADGTPLVSDMSDGSKPSAPRGARAGGAGQGGPGGGVGVPGVGGPGMGMGGGSRGRGTR